MSNHCDQWFENPPARREVAELEQANYEKAKKIRERDLEIVRLEKRCSDLEEEFAKQKSAFHCGYPHEKSVASVQGYAFCLDLSVNDWVQRAMVNRASQSLLDSILHRYPNTYVGVIVDFEGARVLQDIAKLNDSTRTNIDSLVSSSRGRNGGTVKLRSTLELAWSLFSAFRNHSSEGPFQILLIGYNKSSALDLEMVVERFKIAEVEIHNLLVCERVAPRAEGSPWQLAIQTGGKNLFYS